MSCKHKFKYLKLKKLENKCDNWGEGVRKFLIHGLTCILDG